MPTFITTSTLVPNCPIVLAPEDERHLIKVLRARAGEIISLTDNGGTLARAEIVSILPLEFKLLDTRPGEKPDDIMVYLPLIEQDRLELAVEKLTELNIKCVQLVTTERSQRRELSSGKWDRLKKTTLSAQKQCGRAWELEIYKPIALSSIVIAAGHLNIAGSCGAAAEPVPLIKIRNKPCRIFVGPEGGFTEKEEKHLESQGCCLAKLGQMVLRTETAAVVFAALVKYS